MKRRASRQSAPSYLVQPSTRHCESVETQSLRGFKNCTHAASSVFTGCPSTPVAKKNIDNSTITQRTQTHHNITHTPHTRLLVHQRQTAANWPRADLRAPMTCDTPLSTHPTLAGNVLCFVSYQYGSSLTRPWCKNPLECCCGLGEASFGNAPCLSTKLR